MTRTLRRLCALIALGRFCSLVALGLLVSAPPVAAQNAAGAPKPDTYLCPDATGGHVDCFLQAVDHLYTMCRQVKSIEIIEFGYEKSTEGVNGAKSEYCIDKHRNSIARPYRSALLEAGRSAAATSGIRKLYDMWLASLSALKWNPGESDDEYKARVARPYGEFSAQAGLVRAALETSKSKSKPAKAATTAASTKSKAAN